MKQMYELPLVLEPQPEGGYTITCPVIPNLVTEADTLEDVSANVADALTALIELCHDLGKPLPAVPTLDAAARADGLRIRRQRSTGHV
jgi:antitoxin HicB